MGAAADKGHNLMLVAFAGPAMREVLDIYRSRWDKAGHAGRGKVAMGFHMFCHEDRDEAHRIARPNVNAYFQSLIEAIETDAGWGKGTQSSKDYPGYEQHMKKLRETSFDTMLESGAILAGTPDDICKQLSDYIDVAGEFEYLSMQVNFHMLSVDQAAASMRLFSEQVMPGFR